MSLFNKLRKVSSPKLSMFIGAKVLVGIGIGLLLAQELAGTGWIWIIVGICLSLPGLFAALKIQE
jgi:F0F1-type ATP synthase assembly protein I